MISASFDGPIPGSRFRTPSGSRGFSLIEVAIVLFIITLVLGSLLVPLGSQVEQRQISDTQKALDEIKEALIGFALVNGYLPCPDKTGGGGAGTANDGAEDATGGACVVQEGNLPWQTLGVSPTDTWGNRFRYRVTNAFSARSPGIPFTLASAGTLTVMCPATACPTATNYTTTSPAVLLSHGKNGWGAMNASTVTANPAPTSTDELENTDGTADSIYVSRPPSPVGSTAGEFDDVVAWLSVNILFNRMVAGGKLP